MNSANTIATQRKLRARAAPGHNALFAVATVAFSTLAGAAPVNVPNGDFSAAGNNGSIGGGIIGASGSSVLIGAGPWRGSFNGVAGFLAPPLLSIGSGRGTISGLAGVDALGIVNNGSDFEQVLGTALAANRHYVLKVDVDAGVPLDLGVLNSGNGGVAITAGSTELASSVDALPGSVSLALLYGTTYRLVLTHDTASSVSGNVGVKLFAQPHSLINAALLTAVNFGNVVLTSSVLNPLAAGVASGGGTPQGATVNTGFGTPLSVLVLDNENDPVANALVTFNAPGAGASAVLSSSIAISDAGGEAHVVATANGIAGGYQISASVAGVATPATFSLTNLAGAAAAMSASLGTPQNAQVNAPFAAPLQVLVLDALNAPVNGITVNFSAPGQGPSASFVGGASATTNALGLAQVNAVANTVAGTYLVTAHVSGAPAAGFTLTNVAGPTSTVLPAGGTPQSAMVSTSFGTPLGVHVTDAFGNPRSGVLITFSAPLLGASASFPPAGNTSGVLTDSSGNAQVLAVANATAGSYQVTATGVGLATGAQFNLTNSSTPVPHGSGTSGGGQGANVNAAFQCLLQLKITSDGTTAMPGVSIDFVAPSSGPSATLSNGISSGTTVTTTSDANGLTSVNAVANAVPGSYAISAGVTGSGSALASYQLTNFGAGERVFANGFELQPALCANR